ncbi:lipid IV(A) 3-deoxy-D-manno-octulosonic acid transferase [Luteimonas sp. e5]
MKARFSERLLRGLYSAVLYLLLPVTLYHLVWRGFRHPAYLSRWNERYARYGRMPAPAPAPNGRLWLHAVSVGEVAAAAPLVDALLQRHPHKRLVLTAITPTGSERIQARWGGRVEHVYLPYDLPGAVGRFLEQYRPERALVMETELWPNLLFACRDRGIPLAILNARLSARSLRGYRVLAPLVSRALATVGKVCAQSRDDARRFIALGARADAVEVTGNLKYDVAPPADAADFVREFHRHAGRRPVWMAASTHPEEELPVLIAHRRLRRRWPDLLLLWAPRHPERFAPVAERLRSDGLRTLCRSRERWPAQDSAAFVIDTLGELPLFFNVADVAFVGGSLQPIGGHNLLEPAAVGCAVVSGPHLFNFSSIATGLEQAGAMRVVNEADALAEVVEALLADDALRARMGEAGRALAESGRGALARTLEVLGL